MPSATLHPAALNFLVSLWLLGVANLTFWPDLWEAVGGWEGAPTAFLITLPLFVLACVWLTLELLTWGRAARPVLATVLLLSAGASYFMWKYGIVFDRGMVANLVETHPAEALELSGWDLWGWIALLGLLPAILLWRVRIAPQRWYRRLLGKGIVLAAVASGVVLIVAPFFQSYAGLVRNHRDLRLRLVPINFLAASHSYLRARLAIPESIQPIGTDAHRVAHATPAMPTLLLLVIGETARSSNFSLNGYARATNPELAAQADLVSLRQVRSCGTSTAVSLPCMFLDVGREGYEDGLARRRESLLDVLQRAGVNVLWRDNNSGCKGVCDRVPTEDLSALKVPGLCNAGECWDEILLHGLQERLDKLDRDTVIVLHMKGSHGPAYYRRVPPAFEHFGPMCKTNQLDRCSRQSILDAYDNTLRYTDHFLASSIELLKRNAARFNGAMIYVSDHGESLGENGLYLHGLPYAMAPAEQTHVPMLLWMPGAMLERAGIDPGCLRRRQYEALSHDHLYHSVLGLLEVQTRIHRADRDLFDPCTNPLTPAIAKAGG